MPVNPKIKMPLVWLWSVDIYFYALAFPVISCFVNRQLTVSLYALPGLITCLFGGILNLRITEKRTMAMLYDRWFLQITLFDAVVWMAYFALWMTGVFPDRWYPVASAVMHVTTVQLSMAIRSEFENRLFPESDEKTEFDNARGILCNLLNAAGCLTILLLSIESFMLARAILLFAMVVDNGCFIWIWRDFQKHGRDSRWLCQIG